MNLSQKHCLWMWCLLLGATLCSACSSRPKSSQEAKTDATDTVTAATPAAAWYEGEVPFTFDYREDYPETDIRLSELADISYIPLETNDSVLLRLRGACKGNEWFLTPRHIYMHEEQQAIYVFGRDGSFVRKIDHYGGGPKEYHYISSYIVDTLHNELLIQDGDWRNARLVVYDLEGNFLRDFTHTASEIVLLNDSLLLTCRQDASQPYRVVRRSDASLIRQLPIRRHKPKDVDIEYLSYGCLTTTPRGVLMAHLDNDTIYEMGRDLTLRPRIIDQSNYHERYARILPTMETGRYLTFYILRGHNGRYKTDVPENFYIYDKKERQIYKMKDYPDNSYWRLMDDYPHIDNWGKAQNPNVSVRSRQIYAINEGNGKHGSPELLRIASTRTEDDNPILEVMTFHDVESVK